VTARTTERFRKALANLPEHIQQQASEAYRRFRRDPSHPSLRFKPVHATEPIYSARVSRGYRALCLLEGDTAVWFWIGPHAEYDRILRQR
jgi:mRNA-degrading endonuclease RelE of RelBE toxin-antitoxin system